MKEVIRQKYEEAKRKVEDFWNENAVAIMMAAPAVLGVVAKVMSVVGKHSKIRKEEMIKDKSVWDPVVGHYWRLKRKLTKDEWLYITKKRKSGEMLGDILESLHVLR